MRCEVGLIDALHLEPHHEPTQTFVAPTIGENNSSGTTPFGFTQQSRAGFYQDNHLQTIKFKIAQILLHNLMTPRGEAEHDRKARVLQLQARHELFPQIFAIVDTYIGTPELGRVGKVDFRGQDPREIGLQMYVDRIVGRLRDSIFPDEKAGEAPLLPILNRFKPIGTTSDVNFVTTRAVKQTQKSHLSGVVSDTKIWEQTAAFIFEAAPQVVCYARNDRLGLVCAFRMNLFAIIYAIRRKMSRMAQIRILASLVRSSPSQFFQSTRHWLSQAFVRSTIQRFLITTNPCLAGFSCLDTARCWGVGLAANSMVMCWHSNGSICFNCCSKYSL